MADACHRQLHRPQGRSLPLGLLHRQLAAPASVRAGRHHVCPTDPADALFLRAVDDLHRLEQLGPASPSCVKRPRILQGRARAAVASGPRPAAPAVYRQGRRLETPAHLGHGDCCSGREPGRLSGLLPDQHGRPEAAVPERPCDRQARFRRPCLQDRRDGAPALYRGRSQALDRLAPSVCRCEQRWAA